MDTTFDEARRCPRCEQPGHATLTKKSKDNTKSFSIVCLNERCPWFETRWIVETLPDGSIPEPKLRRRKSYPVIPDRTAEVQASLDRSLEQQLNNPKR